MKRLKIVKITKLNKKNDRYDLTVNSTKNFFANDILIHNTSVVIGKVLCKKPLKWYEKVLKKVGVNIVDTQYDLVYSSRNVIKNCYADKESQSYYSQDIWGIMAEKYKDCIKDGVSLYCEIVGQLPNGSWVQKNFDYGCETNTAELYVYRMTYTNLNGDVFEFTTPQVQRYCQKFGLKMVPIFYYGKAMDWDSTINTVEHWHENFLNKLIAKYTEKDCYMCKNKQPEEGVCLIKESDFYEGYKLKSFRFLEKESAELDKGEVNIEDNQEIV